MSRALLTLLAGIVLAVLLAAAIAGSRDLLAVLGPILVTTGIGLAVLAVVAGRARLRERAEQLDADVPASATTSTHRSEVRTPDEDADRG